MSAETPDATERVDARAVLADHKDGDVGGPGEGHECGLPQWWGPDVPWWQPGGCEPRRLAEEVLRLQAALGEAYLQGWRAVAREVESTLGVRLGEPADPYAPGLLDLKAL